MNGIEMSVLAMLFGVAAVTLTAVAVATYKALTDWPRYNRLRGDFASMLHAIEKRYQAQIAMHIADKIEMARQHARAMAEIRRHRDSRLPRLLQQAEAETGGDVLLFSKDKGIH